MNRCRMELSVKQNARDTQMSTRVTEAEVVLPAQLANQNTVFYFKVIPLNCIAHLYCA